jgi:hypothetical protein
MMGLIELGNIVLNLLIPVGFSILGIFISSIINTCIKRFQLRKLCKQISLECELFKEKNESEIVMKKLIGENVSFDYYLLPSKWYTMYDFDEDVYAINYLMEILTSNGYHIQYYIMQNKITILI